MMSNKVLVAEQSQHAAEHDQPGVDVQELGPVKCDHGPEDGGDGDEQDGFGH